MATLQEIAKRIEVLSGMDDLDDKELKELQDLNSQAAKMQAKEQAKKTLEAAQAEAEAKRKEEQDAAIQEAVKRERERLEAAGNRLPMGQAPYQTQYGDESKYDNLDATDLSLLIEVQRAFAGKGENVRVSPSALKQMARRVASLKETNYDNEKPDEARKALEYVKNAFKAGTGLDVSEVDNAIKSGSFKAATDPMYTGGSGIGSDWVGTAYSTEIWRKIRASTRVVSNLPQEVIPDGYSNKTWPIESTDMTWYKVAEATASDGTLKVPAATITASQIATANKNITIGKLGARGLYTQELDEDSLIRFAPQLRMQLEVSGAEMLESLVIDGDVETSANKNINDIAGTPASTDYFLTFDGFRKLALVTNTANSLSAGGSLNIDDFLSLLKLMGSAGLAGSDPTKVAFIPDGNTYYAMAKLPEVKTKDVNSAATVENGFVNKVWNVPVIPSWQMHKSNDATLATVFGLANTAGKVDVDTVANNTRGAVVAVRWDQWKLAYKRRMTIETTRIANADSWEIVALTRLGLGYRDSEASAILYNVGV